MVDMADRELGDLLRAGADKDEGAWHELVRRYASLVAFVIRHYRLNRADTQDVSQLVWLRLVEHLSEIREPAALPAWLATTTRRECERYLRVHGRSVAMDPVDLGILEPADGPDVDELLLATERRQALRDGLALLTPRQRRLLTMLTADPPHAYAEISRILNIPIGSIGPTRSRALEKLRDTAPVRAYFSAERAVPVRGCP
jgi:RNA polymerase sigma factor (sigma-70 family)